jgi:hypothetical protein
MSDGGFHRGELRGGEQPAADHCRGEPGEVVGGWRIASATNCRGV